MTSVMTVASMVALMATLLPQVTTLTSAAGVEDCFVSAAKASLSLTPLMLEEDGHSNEFRVWLLEPGSVHYFVQITVTGNQADGRLWRMLPSLSNDQQNSGAVWCALTGSFVSYESTIVKSAAPNWKEMFHETSEAMMYSSVKSDHVLSHDSPLLVIEGVNGRDHRRTMIDLGDESTEADVARSLRLRVLAEVTF